LIKLGSKGSKWLKGVHILMVGAWLGTALAVVLIGFVEGCTSNGDELYAFNAAIKLMEELIIIPASLGVILTSVLLSSLTKWGFFIFTWIKVKLLSMVFLALFGTFYLGEWIKAATALADMQRGMALQNQTYLHYIAMYNYGGSLQTLLLIAAVVISVFKTWGAKNKNST